MNPHLDARMPLPRHAAAAFPRTATGHAAMPVEASSNAIALAADAAPAARLVEAVGGIVSHEPASLRQVGTRPTAGQRDRTGGLQGVLRLHGDGRPTA